MKTYITPSKTQERKNTNENVYGRLQRLFRVYCCYCLIPCCLYYSYKFFKIIHNENHVQRIWLGSSPCEMILDH